MDCWVRRKHMRKDAASLLDGSELTNECIVISVEILLIPFDALTLEKKNITLVYHGWRPAHVFGSILVTDDHSNNIIKFSLSSNSPLFFVAAAHPSLLPFHPSSTA